MEFTRFEARLLHYLTTRTRSRILVLFQPPAGRRPDLRLGVAQHDEELITANQEDHGGHGVSLDEGTCHFVPFLRKWGRLKIMVRVERLTRVEGSMEELPDADLVARCRRGEAAAFSALVDRYGDALWRYLIHRTRDRDRARDLFQASWEKALNGLKSLQGDSFRSYLFSIAFHLLCDETRRAGIRKRRWGQPVDADEYPEALVDDSADPRDEAISREERERLDDAILHLPENQLEVLLLRIEAELPFKEIAEVLGCPIGTALTRMHQATEMLRKMLVKVEE